MNIFELIVSDPHSYQQVAIDFSDHYSNWNQFKNNMHAVFNDQVHNLEHLIIKSKDIWTHIHRKSPELIPVMIEFYHSTSSLMKINSKH